MKSGTLNSGTLKSGTFNSGTLKNGTLNSGTFNSGSLNFTHLFTQDEDDSDSVTKDCEKGKYHHKQDVVPFTLHIFGWRG